MGFPALVAACLSAVLLGTIGGEACSCGERTLCETFEFSSVVMQASAFSRSNSTNDTAAFSDPITYGIDVLTLYKGEADVEYGDTVTFLTESGGSFCGVYLELGVEYLVDFRRHADDGELHAVSCGLIREWSAVDAVDLADLESGCSTSNSTMADDDGGQGADDDRAGTTDGAGAAGDDDGGGGGNDGAGSTNSTAATNDSSSASDTEGASADEQSENSSLRRISFGSFGVMVACFVSCMALGLGV